MFNRRNFLQSSLFSSIGLLLGKKSSAGTIASNTPIPPVDPHIPVAPLAPEVIPPVVTGNPVVVSTWDAGLEANKAAWQVLSSNGRALDAVEAGVRVTESSLNCCVGLGANPDRDGHVTLDASIMDDKGNCGSVGCLERIKHPISVARRVMEKTPHVMLVGAGAQQFAVAEGFPLEEDKLSDDAKKAYEEWLKKSEYKPVINIENSRSGKIDESRSGKMENPPSGKPSAASFQPGAENIQGGNEERASFAAAPVAAAPSRLPNGEWNHDTIGMVAMDASGNLSGSCTTSGMGFKMRGRLGDSPIIGAGLFVDNEIGAATATGQGEDVIRICGTHTVVELMRQGLSPEQACRRAVERIIRVKGEKAKEIQVAFLAINKKGEVGAFAIHKGFSYALRNNKDEKLVQVASYYAS